MEPGVVITLLVTGVVVGLGQGLLGVGGAFIMVPVMVAVFTGMDIPTDAAVKLAFGTSLLVIFPTAVFSSWAHHRRGAVWWKAAIVLGIAAAAGSVLGATLTSRFISGSVIKVVFGAVVILASVRLLTSKLSDAEEDPDMNPLVWACCGFLLGMVSGLLGIGGGIIMVPVMTIVLKFRMHRAVGTSTAVMLFSSSAGALGYILNGLGVSGLPAQSVGYFNLPAWICLATTSIVMTQVGAWMAHRLKGDILRIAFSVVMLFVGLSMVGAFNWLGWP